MSYSTESYAAASVNNYYCCFSDWFACIVTIVIFVAV